MEEVLKGIPSNAHIRNLLDLHDLEDGERLRHDEAAHTEHQDVPPAGGRAGGRIHPKTAEWVADEPRREDTRPHEEGVEVITVPLTSRYKFENDDDEPEHGFDTK